MGSRYNSWEFTLWLWRNTEGRLNFMPDFNYTSRTYNYRRGYFAQNGTASIYTGLQFRSNISYAWQGNYTHELRPDKTLEKSSWVQEYWFNLLFTKDYHLKVYYTPNYETQYHCFNLLLSYNYSPGSWVLLAVNEGIDNSRGKLSSKQRIITLKVSKLIS